MKYVLMRLNRWKNCKALTPFPLPIQMSGHSIGFLEVYDSLKDLRRDSPRGKYVMVEDARRPKRGAYGAYYRGTLCCTGTKREMENKVENEQRGKLALGWEVRPMRKR